MVALLDISQAQFKLRKFVKARRLAQGLTQAGLSKRAGVSLASLRKFEQKGLISLESFLKLLLVVDALELVVNAAASEQENFSSIDEVLAVAPQQQRKKGWRT